MTLKGGVSHEDHEYLIIFSYTLEFLVRLYHEAPRGSTRLAGVFIIILAIYLYIQRKSKGRLELNPCS